MKNSEVDEIHARMSLLERRVKRLQIACASLVSAVLFMLLVGAAAPQDALRDAKFRNLEADRIIVRNQSGDQLAIWASDGMATGVALDITKHDGKTNRVLARLADLGGIGQFSIFSINDRDNQNSIMLMADERVQLLSDGGGKGPGLVLRGTGPFISSTATIALTYGLIKMTQVRSM